jgi:hypothetical protein
MVRSKQQALMFLLGAVLVGGVLGFSADRVVAAKKAPRSWAQRTSLYDELGITTTQRTKIDSLLDESSCKAADLWKPIKPAMDSLMAQQRQDWVALLTPEQRAKLATHEARFKARQDSVEKARAADRAARPSDASEHPRRCGGPRPGMGPGMGGGPGPSHGPGGPFFQ